MEVEAIMIQYDKILPHQIIEIVSRFNYIPRKLKDKEHLKIYHKYYHKSLDRVP